jgi:hypothetical protein
MHAKQSQFLHGQQWARGGKVVGAASGIGCTNKANLPTGTERDAGRRSHQRGRWSGLSRQTNPICPTPTGKDAGRQGWKGCHWWDRVVQANPICHRGQGRPSPRPEALTMPRIRGHVRQTKPICRRREEWGEARQRRPGRRRWVRACETKPISPERSEGASTAREESYDELDLPRASEKQSQFADTDSRWTRAGEVTSGALARAHCAKQTQSAPDRQWRPLPRPQVLPALGTNVQNEANLPRTDSGARCQGRERCRHWGQTCKTKPISPRATGRASTVWRKSYDELDPQRASAKQSQFPHEQQWARAGKGVGAAGGTELYKQSQLAGGGQEGARPGTVAYARAAGSKRAKQSQFRGSNGGILLEIPLGIW